MPKKKPETEEQAPEGAAVPETVAISEPAEGLSPEAEVYLRGSGEKTTIDRRNFQPALHCQDKAEARKPWKP